MKLLVIEDNPRLALRLKQQLTTWFLVEVASSGDEGLRLAATNSFSIVLLDLGLPDAPGLTICQELRKLSKDLPILIVTGIDTIQSRVDLLDSGADDYITKPFDGNELRARIHALIRRRNRTDISETISVGDLTIYPASRLVQRAGQTIELRRKEFDILEYLCMNRGRVMTREMIINHAWSSTTSSWIGSVDVHIKQLRDKVDKPFSHPLIKTSYGVGYTIQAPVTEQQQVKSNQSTIKL